MVKLFEATDKNLHTGLSKEDLGDILAEIDDLKVTYNCVDGKLLHVNYLINFCWLDKSQFSFLLLELQLMINIIIHISKNLSMT